jgi:hypothetical protein
MPELLRRVLPPGAWEFVFDQRVDLVSKPDASITGYLYMRDAIKGQTSLDKLDTAFAKTAAGVVTPLESPSQLADVFREIEPTAKNWRIRYSKRSGYARTEFR